MTRFTTTVRTDDIMDTSADAVWAAMHDPDLLAELAPAVAAIATDGDTWCWRMGGISALGMSVAPSFTERMVFDEAAKRIEFEHAPPPGSNEAAGASGTWLAVDTPAGAYVGIELTAHVDLPLPRAAGRAVRAVMERTIVHGGQRFARNLMAHLGVTASRGMQVVDAADWPRVASSVGS
jgi:carbon monoxide dehydrogenase subunit G